MTNEQFSSLLSKLQHQKVINDDPYFKIIAHVKVDSSDASYLIFNYNAMSNSFHAYVMDHKHSEYGIFDIASFDNTVVNKPHSTVIGQNITDLLEQGLWLFD